MESECRKDGYYLAIVKEGSYKGRVISVLSKNGRLFYYPMNPSMNPSDFFWYALSAEYLNVLIDTRVDEVYVSNYSQDCQPTE